MNFRLSTFKNWLERIKCFGIRNSFSLFQNLKKDGCFALRHLGNDFYIRGNTVDFAVFNSIFAKGEYDLNIGFKPEYIIDAGAYTGVSTVYFRHKYPKAKIIAVEPEKSNFDLLVRNTKPYKNIFCVNAGIYGEDIPLVISDHSAEKYAFRVELSTSAEESVPGYRIETLMKEFQLPHIDILKMDIEGAEYSVFALDPNTWLGGVRVIVTELHEFIHPGVRELVLGKLKDSGFKLSWKSENLVACKDISANANAISFLD